MLSCASKNLARIFVANSIRSISSTPALHFRGPFHPFWYHDHDPFLPMRRRFPFRSSDPFAMLDHFFDDHFNLQIRDNTAKMQISDKGDLTYQVDVSGFRPEELKVSVEGDEIVIEGEHKEQAEGETVHRQFIRRFRIPEGISKDTVKCDIDAKGCLTVNAKKVAVEGAAERKSIPIETKATEEPKSIGGEK